MRQHLQGQYRAHGLGQVPEPAGEVSDVGHEQVALLLERSRRWCCVKKARELRKKLAQATGGKHYIETVWGREYVIRDPEETNVTMPATANAGGNPGVRLGSAVA